MCGILGVYSQEKIDREKFEYKLKKISHRGPDDFGTYYHNDNIAFGQTRLSIIDLSSAGHQPMHSSCGRYTLIYNGEVYNFKELKTKLIAEGFVFETATDSEVILNGYIRYKENIVEQLNGMFAFSIYDHQTKNLFLARDRSGIKPLYVCKKNNSITYSSEIKAITDDKSVCEKSKILFLLFGYIPEPYTINESIFMFPPGSYGNYSNGELSIVEYYEYQYTPKVQDTYDEVLNKVNDLLEKSIERHLISDAPIGTFLSGGLDSSLLTAIASKYKNDLRTLSLVFDDEKHSEEYYQNLIVDKYKTKHVKYCITEKEFIDSIEPFVQSLDQPTVDGINTYLVSKAAKESGLTTVLSGVGGDEIFYGYPAFKRVNALSLIKKIPYPLIKVFEFSNKYKKLDLLNAEKELALYLPVRALFSPSEISKILNIDKKLVFDVICDIWNLYNSSHITNNEDKISFFERKLYMQGQLLRDSDVFGMANSLEIRVPFLDNTLVDYVTKIKPEFKFGLYNKQIIADIGLKHLPIEVIERPKMGFVLPFEKWFRNNIEMFDFNEVMKDKFISNEISWSRLWALYILERFEKNEV